jgi:serine protease AprX
MNLSLGRGVYGSYTTDLLCQAVEAAWNAGIVVVVAAGNQGRNNNGGVNGYGTIGAPGNDPYVITVGAMKTMNTAGRTDDRIASYSSKGPTLYDHLVKPDLVAPGNQIRSVLNNTTGTIFSGYKSSVQVMVQYFCKNMSGGFSGDYMTVSGTSMATPVVSGAAALLIQLNPALTPDQVKARLMKTAYKTFPTSSTATDPTSKKSYTSYYDIFTVGAGYLDIGAALANSDVASAPALSPAVTYSNGKVLLVNGTNVVWGSNVVWGDNVVWGSTVLLANNVVWGSNVVWGDSTMSGFNVVWGDGTNGTVNPANVVWGSGGSTILDAMDVLTLGEN